MTNEPLPAALAACRAYVAALDAVEAARTAKHESIAALHASGVPRANVTGLLKRGLTETEAMRAGISPASVRISIERYGASGNPATVKSDRIS